MPAWWKFKHCCWIVNCVQIITFAFMVFNMWDHNNNSLQNCIFECDLIRYHVFTRSSFPQLDIYLIYEQNRCINGMENLSVYLKLSEIFARHAVPSVGGHDHFVHHLPKVACLLSSQASFCRMPRENFVDCELSAFAGLSQVAVTMGKAAVFLFAIPRTEQSAIKILWSRKLFLPPELVAFFANPTTLKRNTIANRCNNK